MHLYSKSIHFFKRDDFFAESNFDASVLHILGGPGQIVRIFFASGSGATTVDEIQQTVLRMQVGNESEWALRRSQGSKVFKKASPQLSENDVGEVEDQTIACLICI